MLSKGREIPEFFPDVVKNVVVKSIEVKKMVYIYLVHYADFDDNCREIALLSINSFQKDMSGTNQLIRGLALRVMTSIRVPDIIQIQLLAVRKCAADSSPYVRKCAANALPKIYTLDPEQLDSLKQILDKLLKDASTMVLGSAVASFNEICPTSYDILHRNYRKLCHLLADMDEWTQVAVLDVMTRYIRNQFVDPAPGSAVAAKIQAKHRSTAAVQGRTRTRRVVKKAFYSDEEDESEEEIISEEPKRPEIGSIFTGNDAETDGNLDADHRLILKSSLPLLKSRNSGVVLGVCSLHYYCGIQSVTTTQQIGKALVRILRNHREVQYVVLSCINTMARERPQMFRPFISDFFVKATDPVFNRLLKLEILASICTKENIIQILKELQMYIKESNVKFVCATVRAIGRVADVDPSVAPGCMTGIMHLILCTKVPDIISECVVCLRQLLQQNMQLSTSTIVLRQLIKLLIVENGIDVPLARSSIVWLVGEFNEALSKVAPDILRILAQGYVEESNETKMQIMNFAIKLALQQTEDENVQALMTYVLEMSRYDTNTDLRDRARFMTAIMGLAPANENEDGSEGNSDNHVDEEALSDLNEHAKAILLAPKPPPVTLTGSVEVEGIPNFSVGSLSAMVGHYLSGYQPIPSWPAFQPDPSVRDAVRYMEGENSPMSGSHRQVTGTQSDSESDDEKLKAMYAQRRARRSSDSSSSSSSSSSESSDSGSDESGTDGSSNQSDEQQSSPSSSSESEEDIPIPTPPPKIQASSSAKQVPAQGSATSVTRQPVRRVQGNPGKKKSNEVFGDDLSSLVMASSASSSTIRTKHDLDLLGEGSLLAQPTASDGLADFLAESITPDSNKSMKKENSQDNMFDLEISASALSISAMEDDLLSLTIPPTTPAGQITKEKKIDDVLSLSHSMSTSSKYMSSMRGIPSGTSTVNPSIASNKGNSISTIENVSEPRAILKPELGGGLGVTLIFRSSISASAYPGAACVYLTLKNHKDYAMRRVKVTFPTDVRKTNIPDVPILNPGQEIQIPMEIVLSGLSSKLIEVFLLRFSNEFFRQTNENRYSQ